MHVHVSKAVASTRVAASVELSNIPRVPTPTPVVFISFSRESEEHIQWVRELAAQLRNDGVDARLDEWEVAPGGDLSNYMSSSIRKAGTILLICTPEYRRKFESVGSRLSGVAFEARLINADVMKGNAARYVPIIRKGTDDDSVPLLFGASYRLDFTDSEIDQPVYNNLLARLFHQPSGRPPLKSRIRTKSTPSSSPPRYFRLRSQRPQTRRLIHHQSLSVGHDEVVLTVSARLDGSIVWVGGRLTSDQNRLLWEPIPADFQQVAELTSPSADLCARLLADRDVRLHYGQCLVKILFGGPAQQAKIMTQIDPSLHISEASVLSRPVDLWIESYDDEVLNLPWRLLAFSGHFLETFMGWSISVARKGLRRPAQVDMPTPASILAIGPHASKETDSPHFRNMERHFRDSARGAEPRFRYVTTRKEVEAGLRELRPSIVYYYGFADGGPEKSENSSSSKAAHGAHEAELCFDRSISVSSVAELLHRYRESLRVLFVNALWSHPPSESVGRILSPLCSFMFLSMNPFFTPKDAQQVSLRVLGKILEGISPAKALQLSSDDSDSRFLNSPTLWRRAQGWITSPAAQEPRISFPALKTWLNRDHQRDRVFGRLSRLVDLGRPAGARALAFLFLGTPEDHPELFGDGLPSYISDSFDNRVDIIELPIEGLPESTDFHARSEVLVKIQASVGASTEADLKERLRSRTHPRRTAVFWLHWGTYPHPHYGRSYTPEELIRWFGGIRDGALAHLPEKAYIATTIGCVAPSNSLQSTHDGIFAMIETANLRDSPLQLHILDSLGFVTEEHIIEFLRNYPVCFNTIDSASRNKVAKRMLAGRRTMLYAEAIQKLERVYQHGPTDLLLQRVP